MPAGCKASGCGPLGAGVCAECAPNAEAGDVGLRPGPLG